MNTQQIKEYLEFEPQYKQKHPEYPREYVIEAWILSIANPLEYFGVGTLKIKKKARDLSLEILQFLEKWERNHSQKGLMRAMKNPELKLAYEAGCRDGFCLQINNPELKGDWDQEQKDWYFAGYSSSYNERIANQN